jgi:hypothetical protein
MRRWLLVGTLWVLSLFVVAGLVYAQVYATNPVTPKIVAGPDFGIRIDGEQNGIPVGLPVVKINGQWVTVKFGTSDPKATLH